MSILEPGDELLHYRGGQHRLNPPDGVDPAAWKVRLDEHTREHLRIAIRDSRFAETQPAPVATRG